MVDAVTERNRRQYLLMLHSLEQYERFELSLRQLIDNLEALRSILEDVPDAWHEAFVEEWGDLEQVYAVVLDEGMGHLTGQDIRVVNQAIGAIKAMVQAKVAEPPTE